MEIRRITAAAARDVRHPVLRAGLPFETAILPHDDDPETLHLGAYEDGRLVGVATYFPEMYPDRPGLAAWRLRGMATLPEMRGRGAGRMLLEEGMRAAIDAGAVVMWFHARTTARGFYEKLGFISVGDEFFVPMTGPHYVMFKQLAGNA